MHGRTDNEHCLGEKEDRRTCITWSRCATDDGADVNHAAANVQVIARLVSNSTTRTCSRLIVASPNTWPRLTSACLSHTCPRQNTSSITIDEINTFRHGALECNVYVYSPIKATLHARHVFFLCVSLPWSIDSFCCVLRWLPWRGPSLWRGWEKMAWSATVICEQRHLADSRFEQGSSGCRNVKNNF